MTTRIQAKKTIPGETLHVKRMRITICRNIIDKLSRYQLKLADKDTHMDISLLNAREDEPRLKVSIPIRLIGAFTCLLPVFGVILSSKLLMSMFVALTENESAGAADVNEALNSGSFFALGFLYLGIVCGIVVIIILARRFLSEVKTASPPIWFFAASGILYLVPTVLYWKAHLLVLEAISPNTSIPSSEMANTGAYIAELLVWSIAAAVLVSILTLIVAVVPLSSQSENTRFSLIGATAVEILLIGTAILLPV